LLGEKGLHVASLYFALLQSSILDHFDHKKSEFTKLSLW
jgi:hypothetical protein